MIREKQVLLVGDSIIKLIEPERLPSSWVGIKSVKHTVYTWNSLFEFIEYPDQVIPNNIIVHIGTNDIRDGKEIEDIVRCAKESVKIIHSRNAQAKISISSLIPRGDDAVLDL